MEPRHMKNRQWDIFNTKKYTNGDRCIFRNTINFL